MKRSIRKFPLFFLALSFSLPLSANILVDVGVGQVPAYDPLYWDPTSGEPAWTLTSSCIDINDNGQAACRSVAVGPTISCGFRGIKTCGSSEAHVYRWNGTGLELMSDPAALGDTPSVINNAGVIAGYDYQGAVYPSGGNNGRIWHAPQVVESTYFPVSSINDQGDYIQKEIVVSGGIVNYKGKVYSADGALLTYPGTTLLPFVVTNNGEVIGGQIIQEYLSDLQSPTGNEVPEVSGVGWLLNQADVDALDLTEDGLFDVDRDRLWPLLFYRPSTFANYSTVASDANDFGDFVATMSFGSLHSGYFCTREGESQYRDNLGIYHTVPWVCKSSHTTFTTPLGETIFKGMNNHGDIVAHFIPRSSLYYTYPNDLTSHPWIWLVNAAGGWDAYNVNDLVPANSGYTVVSVEDINDHRQLVANCLTPTGEKHGCILNLTDKPVPADTITPFVRIDSTFAAPLSGAVAIDVSAWDRRSKIQKVKFKLDGTLIGQDTTRPYSMDWDTAGLAAGDYTLKVTAIDNAGNERSEAITVTIAGSTTTPPPTGVGGSTTGTSVEGEGDILAIGVNYLDLTGVRVYFNSATVIKFNDVSDFAIGLTVQYKGIQDENGVITATQLEVN